MISEGGPGDAEAVAALQARVWAWAYADFLPPAAFAPEAADRRAAAWPAALADPSVSLLVYAAGGRMAGVATLGPARDADADAAVGELMTLYVEPAAQGAGVGRTLLDEAERRLAVAYAQATVWTFAANAPARALYARRGWREDPSAHSAPPPGQCGWAPAVRYRRLS